MHRSNARLEQDLAVLLRHKPEMVITSVGSPAPVLKPLHDAGALVFADVASNRDTEVAGEFITGCYGPLHEYSIAAPTVRKNCLQ